MTRTKKRDVFLKVTALSTSFLFLMVIGCGNGTNGGARPDSPMGQDYANLSLRQRLIVQCGSMIRSGLQPGQKARMGQYVCWNNNGIPHVLERQTTFESGPDPKFEERDDKFEAVPFVSQSNRGGNGNGDDDGVTWGDVWPWLLTAAVMTGVGVFTWCAIDGCWYPDTVHHYPAR